MVSVRTVSIVSILIVIIVTAIMIPPITRRRTGTKQATIIKKALTTTYFLGTQRSKIGGVGGGWFAYSVNSLSSSVYLVLKRSS